MYKLTATVGEKGGVCVHGLQKFPVTLYKDQWLALLEAGPNLKKFIEANTSRLKEKAESKNGVSI